MPYQAEISRANPSCFLFLIDQSGSMSDGWVGDPNRKKADELATVLNRLLQNLVIKCAKSEGVRDYYHIGVIGYGATVGSGFVGPLSGKELSPISLIANSPSRIEERSKKIDDGVGGLIDQKIKFPIWFDPISANGTPMCEALNLAYKILSDWLAQHPTCFPPVLIHITDGESTDGDPSSVMSMIKNLSSNDGNVLLFNLHLSCNPNTKSIFFPDSSASLPDQYSKVLFDGASILTPFMRDVAKTEYGISLSDGAKCFVLNADLTLVIQALVIGTQPSNLR